MTEISFCSSSDCARPVESATLCREHGDALTKVLAEIPAILDELHTNATKQARYSTLRAPRSRTDRPLIVNLGAADASREYADAVRLWQARAADRLGLPVRHPDPTRAGRWLYAQHAAGKLATWLDAGKMLGHLQRLTADALKLIDQPAERFYAGPCNNDIPGPDGEPIECGAVLYADLGKPIVACPRCDATYDTKARRDWFLERVDDQLASLADICRALAATIDEVTDYSKLFDRARQWVRRPGPGQITRRGTRVIGGQVVHLYRFGDFRDRLAEDARHAQEKRLQRNARTKEE